jgi:hypothetical protein
MIVVFNHIPKTGGNTVALALSQRFELLHDYVADGSLESFERWKRCPVAPARLRDGTLLLGHYTGEGCRPQERYPRLLREPQVRLVTFLRRPTELALSSYFYRLRLGECTEADFRDVLFEMVGIYAHGFEVTAGAITTRPPSCAYAFVGITELMALSLSRLAHCLGVHPPAGPVGRENASQRPVYPSDWRRVVVDFDRAAAQDHQIYRHAVQRLVKT